MHTINIPTLLHYGWNIGDAFLDDETIRMVLSVPTSGEPHEDMECVDLRTGAVDRYRYGDGYPALRLTISAEPVDYRTLDHVVRPLLIQKNRVGAIKALREHTGWGLKEAHQYCKNHPCWGDYS